jgi:UDP-glucose 4-epimerase
VGKQLKDVYKRALVTGGAGFVGSHLVEELLAEGLEVISLDDYSAGKRINLQSVRNNPRLSEVKWDITERDGLDRYFEGVDVVFHQACSKMTVCLKDPNRDLAVNAEGTLNVLHASVKAKVKKFVHASTGSVYGEPKVFPTDESHVLDPVSYYGVSKLAGEKYVRLFSESHGLDAAILRYYHVFGPRQDNSEVGGVVSIFGRKASLGQPITIFGDGTQIRSFTYVKDVVNINKCAALRPETRGQSYNCASGVKVTIQQLADGVRNYFGKPDLKIEYKDWKIGDIKHFDVNNSKLRSLGFEFQYGFEDGLRLTLDSVAEYLKLQEQSTTAVQQATV